MNTTIFNFQTLLDAFFVIMFIVAGVATWQNSKSSKKSSDETDALTTIKLKDEAIKGLREEVRRLQEEDIKKGKEIAVLQADNRRLEAIVSNRNPELEKFMRDTSASILIIEASIQQLLKLHASPVSNVTINK
jgi:hypothetical protein